MEDKIGVFICTGYGIAEALDIDALCKLVNEEYTVAVCKTVDSCEGPGLERRVLGRNTATRRPAACYPSRRR